jgi:Flp pilus assembly protein TadG
MREASIGQSVSETKDDRRIEKASTKPNSRKSPPVCPGRKESGTNTAASVAVVASTAKKTSSVPWTAAGEGEER